MHAKLLAISDPLTLETMKKIVMGSLWFSPPHSLRELGRFLQGMTLSEQITQGTAGFDDWADGTTLELPFFLFQGEKDVLTSPELARRFFDSVQAPVKAFALIEDCSHPRSGQTCRDSTRRPLRPVSHPRPSERRTAGRPPGRA
ncbi:alpha/beta hydrolase [Streptomyces bambusae]|uniref:alpha/beta hydrolase n=1 Tax=Streptomyces bambusae TaxID=1550616 RepID=UPI001CFD414B|nr:alpha/beta hydrolase [Streptomyces bambusae]MCB5167043.1 alpha/beta hydrolase [Streptomyces bambusae]